MASSPQIRWWCHDNASPIMCTRRKYLGTIVSSLGTICPWTICPEPNHREKFRHSLRIDAPLWCTLSPLQWPCIRYQLCRAIGRLVCVFVYVPAWCLPAGDLGNILYSLLLLLLLSLGQQLKSRVQAAQRWTHTGAVAGAPVTGITVAVLSI
jgi:hypothetical protein